MDASSQKVPNIYEVVVDVVFLDEGTLGVGDDVAHEWHKVGDRILAMIFFYNVD